MPPPMPTSCHHEAAPHAHACKTHLATQYPHHHTRVSLLVVVVAHTRLILPPPPVARSAQPSFIAPVFTVHRYLIYPFLQNLIKCLWSEIHRNCACGLVVFQVCVYIDEWWTDVGKWWLWIESVLPMVCFFFGFLAFWLCDSLSLCVCDSLSLLYYIDKRDRERESRVCRD